ncbi:sensor histidine kinase [Streptomyces sp. NPDC056672]|uniref:sensor histidine kinase n=1 Tax=Streptomyces sp. NPDC056672 TaxID=3345906 RepID=UPI0036C2520B
MRSEPGRSVPMWVEAPSAVALALMSLLEGFRSAGGTLADPAPWVGVIASFYALGRYRLPRTVAALALVSVALGCVLPLLVTLYHFASRNRLREVWVCLGIAVAAGLPWLALALVREQSLLEGRVGTWTGFGNPVLAGLALALGMWAGSRRRLMEALKDQVEQLRVERELRAEQARSAERARIAREMHDVLAHRLSLLMLHMGVLQVQAETLPPAVVARIALLRGTAGQALADLREVLGALRSDEPGESGAGEGGAGVSSAVKTGELGETSETRVPGKIGETGETAGRTSGVMDTARKAARKAATNAASDGVTADGTSGGTLQGRPGVAPEFAPGFAPGVASGDTLRGASRKTPRPSGRTAAIPAPALQDLAELLAEARAAGQRIESEISGDAGKTSTSHRLAVHRLVREALTNARKHAHATTVGVRVHYGWPATTVEVVNGPAVKAEDDTVGTVNSAPGSTSGYGLIGLAERVSALGGHLHAGATGGGWRLSARLPVLSADPSRTALSRATLSRAALPWPTSCSRLVPRS